MEDHPFAQETAPESLLPSVMARIERLDGLLAAQGAESAPLASAADARWEVRAAAMGALGKAHDQAALDALTAGLDDKHPMVRATAIRALGRLGDRAPLDRLIQAAQDSDAEVRSAAVEGLGAMRGQAQTRRQTAKAHLGPISEALRHFWLVLARQPAIFQRNWLLSALLLLLGDGLVLLVAVGLRWDLRSAATVLNLTTTLCTALSIAFTANPAHDEASEIALATATSTRTILLGRLLVVLGATTLISGVASTVMGVLYGRGAWDIAQLWLGPVVLVGSLTLTLTLWFGSWLSLLLVAALEAAQTFHIGGHGDIGLAGRPLLWQTSPAIMCLAALCLVLALVATPRQSRFPRELGDG